MKRLVLATIVLALCACGGGSSARSYVPLGSGESRSMIRWTATTLPPCKTKEYEAPGKFTVLTALGTFDGSSFASSGFSLWVTVSVPKGHSQLPVIALPTLKTSYTVYYGTYTLKSGAVGCFYLAKASYQGVSFNGVVAAAPNVHNFGPASPSSEGELAIAIKGISPKAGSGTLTLKDASGTKSVGSGTVKIEGSKAVK